MSHKKSLINAQYGISFLVKLSVIMLLSSIISGLIFYNFVNRDIQETYSNARFVIKSVNDFLFPSLWFAITVFTLLLSLSTAIISMLVSHRIAGPIYRLEVAMKDFKSGKFYKVHLRDKDEIKGFVKVLNEFTETLLNNFTNAKTRALNVRALIDDGKKECQKEDYEQLKSLNEKLKGEVKELQEAMNGYKT